MSTQLINLSFLESFTKGDTQKMKKYISMFLQSAPDTIMQMRSFHANGDWNGLRTVAHSLKPQLGYMGIDSVKELVLRIEEYAAEHKKPEAISQMIEELSAITEAALIELRSTIEKF